ncbi:MAG: signal peptide peptidase SppA, partial [Bernardetiaceae bacterium]|nr:signal peptide peptidase SppA [Bernardetiaceae bacterium]
MSEQNSGTNANGAPQNVRRVVVRQKKGFGSHLLGFLKYTLATVVGIFAFFTLGFLLLLGLGLSMSSSKDEVITKDSILKLSFSTPIGEVGEDNPFADIDFDVPMTNFASTNSIIEIKKALKQAKDDSKIKGIYLDLSMVPSGWAMLEEVREAILNFKESGKFIYAYGEMYDEKAYLLASLADSAFLNPQGFLEFNGISANVMYYSDMFKKIGVEPEIFRVGQYKSAVEPFLRSDMSEENREQLTSYLNSIWGIYLQNIATNRNLKVEDLAEVAKHMKVRKAGDAIKYGLIDDTLYYDQVDAVLRSRMGIEKKDKKLPFVSLSKYQRTYKSETSSSKNKIAVISAEGAIVSGRGKKNEIGSDKIAAEIRKARVDEDVKAIVLRINSPGGSALASDVMWREVIEAKKVKPVIASMSDLAASGGYYMAMGCDKIVAHPNTITGSIGI